MSQRTTRLRGPLAALLIALGVGAVLLVGEVACFSLHPGWPAPPTPAIPGTCRRGRPFSPPSSSPPPGPGPVTVTQVEIQDPASGEIFTPELILCDQDGHRDGPSMASAWQGPRADFAAHFPGGTQSAVPGTLASQDAVLATLWNPLPPGDRPLTYTIHYRLLGLFPKTETFSYTWDTGEGTVPEGPGRPPGRPAGPAGLRAAERRSPLSPRPLPLWAGGLFVKRPGFPLSPGAFCGIVRVECYPLLGKEARHAVQSAFPGAPGHLRV